MKILLEDIPRADCAIMHVVAVFATDLLTGCKGFPFIMHTLTGCRVLHESNTYTYIDFGKLFG